MPDIVYLVRHAAPPQDKLGRYWGRADPGVDPGELARIAFLAGLAQPKPERLLSSPIRRAAVTAGELAPALGLDVETDHELAEIDFGCFDGLLWTDIEREYPEKARDWMEMTDDFVFPGGEAIQSFFHRTTEAWKRICGMEDPAVMVVAHGGVIAVWLCLFLALPFAKRFQFSVAHGTLTALERSGVDGTWMFSLFNTREQA